MRTIFRWVIAVASVGFVLFAIAHHALKQQPLSLATTSKSVVSCANGQYLSAEGACVDAVNPVHQVYFFTQGWDVPFAAFHEDGSKVMSNERMTPKGGRILLVSPGLPGGFQ